MILTPGDIALIITFGAIGSFIGLVFGVFALALGHEIRTQWELWRLRRQLARMPRVFQNQEWRGHP
jgi:hypothetical protein